MMIVVDDVSDVTQFITVSFRLLLMGPIDNVDTTGTLPCDVVLEKLNTTELIVKFDIAEPVERTVREKSVADVSFPRTTLNLHCNKSSVVVHVNSS
jgi:hypothetical protein